jgi:pyruvate formate lyase activating enzyme
MAVYLKGCPLNCKWCHSPESLSREPQVMLARDRCLLCGECVEACPQDGHEVGPAGHEFAREKCVVCGECTARCVPGALSLKGRPVSAQEIVAKATRMKPFFNHSGGGVTLTGGEVTMQVGFAEAVLAGCKDAGIHTAMETCGLCDWARLQRLARHSDLILYDLKLMDDAAHRRWAGASNHRILDNASRLARWSKRRGGGSPVVEIRVPLIPSITDTAENTAAVFGFMAEVGLPSVTLLPYNPATSAKYEWLGLPCEVDGEPQTEERLEMLLTEARAFGLAASVS